MSENDYQVTAVLVQVARGDLDAHDVMNHPKGEAQVVASGKLQYMYERVCEGWTGRGGADDDFEEILDKVCDQLVDEFRDLM